MSARPAPSPRSGTIRILALAGAAVVAAVVVAAVVTTGCGSTTDPGAADAGATSPHGTPRALSGTREDAARASASCVACHGETDAPTMHASKHVVLGCADCHGGDPSVVVPSGAQVAGGPGHDAAKRAAHVAPRFPERWTSSANPPASFTLLNKESPEFVRFVNPGDLRVADLTCGPCHPAETRNVPTSMMAHSAMVPGSGLYNNGSFPFKRYVVGEFYTRDGKPASATSDPPPTEEEARRGVLPALLAYPRFETFQPGMLFRTFERGTPGLRGLGTPGRTDAVVLTATKTRLNDPNLWFLGTNDATGEYRSSGCTACHVLYANDDGSTSGVWAHHGRDGTSASKDPTIPRGERGHPVKHAFVRAAPSSQCLTCHVHQGSGGIGAYVGEMWWDAETDGAPFYHADGTKKTGRELDSVHEDANRTARQSVFRPQHRGTWSFRNVYLRDIEGRPLGKDGEVLSFDDPAWAQKAVHLADAHFKAGMHCTDCHTSREVHGDGRLYGEMMNPIEIDCADCHGTADAVATLVTSNPAGGTDLAESRTPFGSAKRFVWRDGVLWQRSVTDPDLTWKVPQVKHAVDPASPGFNPAAARAKLVKKDNTPGDCGTPEALRAHTTDRMTCYTCHSSWGMSCAGCHLSQEANRRTEFLHFEGEVSRNEVGYYAQGLRTDLYTLGFHGSAHRGRIGPVRSASSVVATTENANRAIVTSQQPTIASSGHSGSAFSPYTPHTVSGKYDKTCSSCHVNEADDNNAQLAVLFGTGARTGDFVGEWAFVGATDAVAGVRVTEGREPQPVLGSDFHALVRPESAKALEASGRRLPEGHTASARNARSVHRRGEYLFVADGSAGFRVLDVANIANKDAAQRILTAPVSPAGQDTVVRTKDATAVILPVTGPMDPLRKVPAENEEQPVHPLFGYAYVTDAEEGLVVVDVNTLVDGDPSNNDLVRAATFDGGGALRGARGGVFVGRYLYVLCDAGVAVVDVDRPVAPQLVRVLSEGLRDVRAIDTQFRYAAVLDADGMKVVDITEPGAPVLVPGVLVPFPDARGLRLCRTYAYVAAGREGLAVVDVRRFREPRLVLRYDAEGAMDDTTAIVTGLTNAGNYAYVADGRNGLRVLELWSPSRVLGTDGFSPRPAPRLLATWPTSGRAVSVSPGLARDRCTDESGNQISVFGRLGSRPLDDATRRRMYLRDGRLWTVRDDLPSTPTKR